MLLIFCSLPTSKYEERSFWGGRGGGGGGGNQDTFYIG